MISHEPFGHLQHKLWQKEGQEWNWQFDSRPLKVGNRPNPSVCRWSAKHLWKALKESYKFALDLIPIGGLNKKLWARKVPRIQTRTVSGLLLGSPGTKSHSDVGVVEKCREYYMGEGGGFPQIRAMTCPSTKGALENELTNMLVGLMQVRVSNWSLSFFLVPFWSFSMPSTPFNVESWEHAPSSKQFRCLTNLDSTWVQQGTWERVKGLQFLNP
jgi:hypothetical protein